MKEKKAFSILASLALLAASGAAGLLANGVMTYAEATPLDVISASSSSDWYHNTKTDSQGVWTLGASSVEVDAYGGNYAMEGANYLSKKGTALGAYEFAANITVSDINPAAQNGLVGIIPWYLDKDNYLYVEMKFTTDTDYLLSADEKSEGYAIEQIICSGRYNGEAKYVTATSQQENTVFDSLTVASLKTSKQAPKNASGHRLAVKFENNSATATNYKVTISYNDVEIASTYAYYYNAVAKNLSVGFMAQDVKASFASARLNDYYATASTVALARDWKENKDFTYRVLNGTDVWSFNTDNSVSFKTDAVVDSATNKVVSQYKVSGSNIAGYDTNRGFTVNPYKATAEGLPQNYEVASSFKLDKMPDYSGSKLVFGYGLLAWYKDDQNFVDVTLRRTESGLAAAPTIKNELVLYGWMDCSSTTIGENIYDLGSDFVWTQEHTLKVEKKSTGFTVYLDAGTTPVISKSVKDTDLNYSYGYEGYNAQFSASAISSSAIYDSFDEITVLDDAANTWRVAGQNATAWSFNKGTIALAGKNTSKRSYLLGASDISDKNMTVEMKATVSLGTAAYSEVMISPYLVDENNYARIGLIQTGDGVYAYVRASTYTEADMDAGTEAKITLRSFKLSGISLSGDIVLKAEKIDTTLALYVNGTLVYGRVISDIDAASLDYGIYAANADLSISSLTTEGYKKYTWNSVGDWDTSGMKYNEWTIDNDGYLAGDATYSSKMEKGEKDAERNFALKENTLKDNYEMTVDIKATAESEAEDRVGVVMWYLDDSNFMILYLDRWRQDSTVPRTTVYGRIAGETLPTTYNHGGWLAEGDQDVGGMSQTEASQVTNWHTLKVIKEANTFTCYVDTDTNGYISYTVAAGLPSTSGKTVYSGIYAYNDAVLVRSYNIDPVGGFSAKSLPCEAGHPYNASVSAPTLGSYADSVVSDHFDTALKDNVGGGSTPSSADSSGNTPSSSTSSSTSSEGNTPGGGFNGGAIAGIVIGAVVIVGVVVAFVLNKRKKKA